MGEFKIKKYCVKNYTGNNGKFAPIPVWIEIVRVEIFLFQPVGRMSDVIARPG